MGKTPLWRITLAVWSPLLIAASVYGITYKVRNIQANHEYAKAYAVYATCMDAYNVKLAEYNKTATRQVVNGWTYISHTEAQPKMDCYSIGHVRHGTLWLPEYGVN